MNADAGFAARSRDVLFLAAWYLLGSGVLLLLPGLKSHVAPWAEDNPEAGAVWLTAAFLAGAVALILVRPAGRAPRIGTALGMQIGAFCVAFACFLLAKPAPLISRSVLLEIFAGSLLLTVLGSALVDRRWRPGALGGLVVVLAAGTMLEAQKIASKASRVEQVESNLSTAFYTLRSVSYRNSIPGTEVRGGGISAIGDDYLLATGDGRLYVFGWSTGGEKFSIRKLAYRVPANFAEFAADANPQGYAGKPNGGDQADRLQGVQTWQFRVADVRVQEQGDQVRVFVSHHFWYRDRGCFVVRVSSLSASRQAFLAGYPTLAWRTVFESTPCVPLRGDNAVHENNPFAGMEIGGRIGFLSDERLLLTLGDHDFTGVESKQMFAQDPKVSYGKTILIHLDDGSSEIYTSGHRNPQGLYITPQGAIWSTEHGPQGGDELNLLVQGKNYGWPLVTYGSDYGSAAWPLSHAQNRHDGYEQPIFVWIPSIGVSNLVRIERDRFPVWKGDLIVSSLHAHSLYRIRLLDQRVVFSEPIEVGERVRDLIEGHDGRLILWTDTSSIVSLTPAAGSDGSVIFATVCGGCHKAIDGATHSYGPDLAGIVGSAVATAPGFAAYSPALKSQRGKWTKERLDAFVASPQTAMPGTAMTFRGLSDAAQRRAVIEYLAGTHRQ